MLPSRKQKLTVRQSRIIDAVVTGMNQSQAAEHVDVSREYVCRLLKKDHILAEVLRRTEKTKSLCVPRAIANIVSLSEGAESERVRLDANFGLLDRAGHGRRSSDEFNIRHGELSVTIDLS